jgi:hypothetical protein
MKKSKKIAVLFVCASVLASTSTIFAATASKSTGITKDEFVPSKENSVDANNFVKTAAGMHHLIPILPRLLKVQSIQL